MGDDDLERAALALDLDDLAIDRAAPLFDQQDSGCISYGVEVAGHRWFVKTARDGSGESSLENALRLHSLVRHPAIVRPLRSFRRGALTLVYPWIEGRVLNHATSSGSDRSALERFRHLPVATVCAAISTVIEAHVRIAATGYVAVDLYDGCFLFDFTRDQMHLIDLDEYHLGVFTLAADRLPGSRRYMAPEEMERGATIDERTNVFTLGRTIEHLLDSEGGWRGTGPQREIVQRATAPVPEQRFVTIAELYEIWLASSGTV